MSFGKKRNIIETELPDSSGDESQEPPKFPALRTFRVIRYAPGETAGKLETFQVTSHILQYPYDNVVAFFDYVLDPVMGPQTKLHRLLNGYVDVQEVSTPDTTEGTTVQ